MPKVVIVGAGLFGSMAAALARSAGHSVTVIDSQEPMAASKCSGNLTRPGWLASLGKERADTALETLRNLYPVHVLDCLGKAGTKDAALTYVPLHAIVSQPVLVGKVTAVRDGEVLWNNAAGRAITSKGKILVAAGVWSEQLVKMPPIKRLVGASLILPGQITQPALWLYAPYKHAIAYNVDKRHVWMGDGAAILEKNWSLSERVALLAERAKKLGVTLPKKIAPNVGARPYVVGHPAGYFRKVYPNTWVSTGGAKNGLVLAAYQAWQFVESL